MPRKLSGLVALVLTVVCAGSTFASPTCVTTSTIGQQLSLPVCEWVDSSKARRGMIVAFPALTLYAKSWDNIARHLASQGYQVFALEMRGFGRWQIESAKFGGNHNIDFEQSKQDLLDLVTILHMTYPHQKLFCLGESLGSNMILSLVSEHPELASGAILISLGYKNRIHPKMRWASEFAKQMMQPNKALNTEPYSAQYLTTSPALARAFSRDPLINHRIRPQELYAIYGYNARGIADAKKLPQNYPLLIIAGLEDGMFKSAELPKAIETFGTHNVSLILLPGKGHILLEDQAVDPQTALLIDGWLNHQLAPAKGGPSKTRTTTRTTRMTRTQLRKRKG